MITYTHPGKLFTSFHCDYKANGRSLTFRWPIKYPAARGRHNCQVLHYYLCVPNDGAKGGSRDYELLYVYVLDKNYLSSGYLIHGVTKYLANLLWFVPPQVTFTCLLEVTPRILMTFRGTHNPRPGGTFSN